MQTRTTQNMITRPEFDFEAKEQAALSILDLAADEFQPKAFVACISGGLDSVAMATVARKHPRVRRALHIDTQTGVQATQDYVRALCAGWGLPLEIRRSKESYEELCRRYGMLGKGQHNVYFNALKGRVFTAVARELAPTTSDRIVYVSGARSQESARRKANVIPVRHDAFQKRIVWASPIHDWSAFECRAYLAREGVEVNPVSQVLHRSGECNCGAYGTREELEELRFWYPADAAKLDAAMAVAEAAGKWSRWGEPCPKSFGEPNGRLDDYEDDTCEPEACRSCPAKSRGAQGDGA